ncbi:hypothetical protein BCR44DRAFT_1444740 [Catenaria anguillulae PL171]|uniref:Uncharacterized protein n=1 Tax=Catenaria anguillulae PL171 TaxID=765915 RepID=A0A1Y2H7D8_9FUNG|nr:hypothetical protein BCR44DRAFT_1444740 [Catenaria anguillulae PL171]
MIVAPVLARFLAHARDPMAAAAPTAARAPGTAQAATATDHRARPATSTSSTTTSAPLTVATWRASTRMLTAHPGLHNASRVLCVLLTSPRGHTWRRRTTPMAAATVSGGSSL